MIRTSLFILALLLVSAVAQGQDEAPKTSKGVTPVEIKLTPEKTMPGGSIIISGTVPFVPANKTVSITVTYKPEANADSPSVPAKPKTLTTQVVNANGEFNITFTDTATSGEYEVVAFSPDKKGRAQKTFVVLELELWDDDVEDGLGRTFYLAKRAEAVATKLLEVLPPSPGKEELQAKVKELRTHLDKAAPNQKKIEETLQKFEGLVGSHPATMPIVRPLFINTLAWSEEAREEQQELTRELGKLEKKTHTTPCDAIDDTIDALRLVGKSLEKAVGLFSTKGYQPFLSSGKEAPKGMVAGAKDKAKESLLDTLGNFVAAAPENIAKVLGDKPENKTARFAAGETMKVATGLLSEPQDWAKTVIGAATDVVTFAVEQQFGRDCERFEGPLKATFTADFFHKGTKYWAYTIQLDGRLVLRYAKSEGGQKTIKVTGQYEGSASKFTLYEQLIVIDPSLAGNRVFHRAVPPPGMPFDKDAPKAAAFLKPTGFYIPVEGEITDGKVTVRMLAPAKDFEPKIVKGHIVNIFVEPITLVPQIVTTETPYQNAFFILSRSIGQERIYDLTLDKVKKETRIVRDFTREYKDPAGGYVINWNVSVNATNPPK